MADTSEERADASNDAGGSATACRSPNRVCRDECVAPTDPRNCGTCDHDCTVLPNVSGEVTCSEDGQCVVPFESCTAGYAHCTQDPEDGCETDITDPSNCGMCGRVC